jgi:hypothetical protein
MALTLLGRREVTAEPTLAIEANSD